MLNYRYVTGVDLDNSNDLVVRLPDYEKFGVFTINAILVSVLTFSV
jgi:hypothetical protein